MKRKNYLHCKVIKYNNITFADERARRHKTNTYGVKVHDRNREQNLKQLQYNFKNLKYKTSKYSIFKIYEPKEREIYRLPYYPDRIAHHALMNILEPIWEKIFIYNSYACRKNKGIHAAVLNITKTLRKDKKGTKYCLKLDIQKFYPSVDHDVLKNIIRFKIKDKKLLVILDEIINSAPGVPIGNYLSQYFANLYLTYFDHWIKEYKHVKYYYRYADDMVILCNNKKKLHKLRKEIGKKLINELHINLKSNYQVFDLDSRGLDFIGYKFYHNHVLLRKSIKLKIRKLSVKLRKHRRSKNYVRRKLCSYCGWLKYCNSINLCKKYIDNICYAYNLPTPEHIIANKSIISNIINKPIKIIGIKVYEKYYRIYVIYRKPISVISRSGILLKLLLDRKLINKYCIIKFKKHYKVYEITSNKKTRNGSKIR